MNNETTETTNALNALKVEVYDLHARMAELEAHAQQIQQAITEKNAAIRQLNEQLAVTPE